MKQAVRKLIERCKPTPKTDTVEAEHRRANAMVEDELERLEETLVRAVTRRKANGR